MCSAARPMPVDEYTPKLGSLTMENIVATDAQFAGCYFDGLPEQPIERRDHAGCQHHLRPQR